MPYQIGLSERAEAAGVATPVRHRAVFFVPGYDPLSPRRYRELYRAEGQRQADISGYRLHVTGLAAKGGRYRWRTEALVAGQRTDTVIELLVWNDIVRDSMQVSIAGTYRLMLATLWFYLRSGALWRLVRLRPQPMIVALYPVFMLLLQLAMAVLAGWLAWRMLAPLATPLGSAAGIALFALVLIQARRWDGWLYAYYLMHDYAFTASERGRMPAALDARLDDLAARIAAEAFEGQDEVLVVGHSSGAHLAVALVARLRRLGLPPGLRLGLLTLGGVIPMVSFLPAARQLRADLNALAQAGDITWIDISAPGDGACFALADPVAVTGVAPPEAARTGPLVISAAFSESLSHEAHHRTRWRFFRRHIQYLCAFENPLWYDYFLITAGPVALADRFAGRGPSRSRIETPLSGYRDF